MRYIFSYKNPQRHFIDIEYQVREIQSDRLTVQLPSWRPGRYELGNFAKNIQKWEAFDGGGNKLKSKKKCKDCWEIETAEVTEVIIKYTYYAAELNAGSCFLNESQLYVNPVNCCMFVPGRIHEPCELELKIPVGYQVATAMESSGGNCFSAADYHELADSPFIASHSIQHGEINVSGINFHLHFQGVCKPDWTKLLGDFYLFIREQASTMKKIPVKEYHFLFQVLPFRMFHGVEHLASTVIAIGPGYSLMDAQVYDELLGLCCHELFHCWNIKSIRPAEMFPYDYTRENYSRLGYVCEGVTTYYGDYFLFRSGVFREKEYFKTLNERIQKHFHNPARLTMPVTEASFDTWLDGYVPGIPWRKTSIYDEGCLLAFMTDILIRTKTGDVKSLDDVMRTLFTDYSLRSRGYTEEDYIAVVEKVGGGSFSDFFTGYVYGTSDFEPLLREQLEYIGCCLEKKISGKYHEARFGFKLSENSISPKISLIIPDSPADLSGLAVNDEIIAINGQPVKNNLNEWEQFFKEAGVVMTILTDNQVCIRTLNPAKDPCVFNYSVEKINHPSDRQKQAFRNWAKQDF